jgi:Ras-related protein Rab-22
MAEQSVKVVLLGESGVGKSSLALRFVTDEFRPYSEATIGASFMSKSMTILTEDEKEQKSEQKSNERNISFKIWDTAGQEKYRSLAPMYYRGSSAAILVYDIANPSTFAALTDWVNELNSNGPAGLVLAICGNKSDLEDDRMVGRSVVQEYADRINALFIETSAKDGSNVEDMFSQLARRIPPPINLNESLEEDVGLDLGDPVQSRPSCC